jgi:DNA invertase Pin-like site-specific DNA recombinase
MLKAVGVEHVSSEKLSGVTAKRPEVERVLDELKAGDMLVVTKLDPVSALKARASSS